MKYTAFEVNMHLDQLVCKTVHTKQPVITELILQGNMKILGEQDPKLNN